MGRGREYPQDGDAVVLDGREYMPASQYRGAVIAWRDDLFGIYDDGDPSKFFKVNVGPQATGSILTFDVGAQTASRRASLPVLSADDTFAMLGVSQTLSGVNTFSDRMGIGSANTGAASQVASAFASTSGTTQYGYRSSFTGQSDATTRIIGFGSNATTTVAASFTCAQLAHFYTGASTAGAGSTITRIASYHATAQTAGATANLGFFYGTNLAGTGTWCFYNNTADPVNLGTGATTIGGGTPIISALSATAALNFGNTAAQTSADLTIALTGAVVGDVVILGLPAAPNANACFSAWVSAADTVTVRFNNYSAAAIDPASATYRVSVVRY